VVNALPFQPLPEPLAETVEQPVDVKQLAGDCAEHDGEHEHQQALRFRGHREPDEQSKQADALESDGREPLRQAGVEEEADQAAGNHRGDVDESADEPHPADISFELRGSGRREQGGGRSLGTFRQRPDETIQHSTQLIQLALKFGGGLR